MIAVGEFKRVLHGARRKIAVEIGDFSSNTPYGYADLLRKSAVCSDSVRKLDQKKVTKSRLW